MDVYHKALAAGIGVLLLLGLFLGYHWLQAHDAALKAEAKIAADKEQFNQLTAQQKVLDDQLQQIRKDQATGLDTVNKQFNQAQSPQQLATLVAQLMGLKQAPVVITPPATAQNPNPQPTLELPDSPQVKAYFKDCEDCKVNYAAAQKEAAIAKQDKAAAETKLQLMTDERDKALIAAKGGPWIKRAFKDLKIGVCAALGGAAGGQKNPKGAALGALGGAVACSLF